MSSDRNFIIISYYTKNTGYELEVQNLIKSLEKFDLPYYIEPIDDLGSWQANTHYKVKFIAKCLKKFDKPIVFIDADAVVEQDPVLFDNIEEDIAVHYRYITDECSKLLSGTLYMKPGLLVDCVLFQWEEGNKWNPDRLEQVSLEDALYLFTKVAKRKIKVLNLPASYCNIFDLMNVDNPVITHYQASRRLK